MNETLNLELTNLLTIKFIELGIQLIFPFLFVVGLVTGSTKLKQLATRANNLRCVIFLTVC